MHLQTRLLLAARPLHDVYLGTRQRQLRVLGLLRVGRAAFQAFRRDVLPPARVEVGRIRYGSLVASCKCLPPSAMQLQGDGEGQQTGQEGSLCWPADSKDDQVVSPRKRFWFAMHSRWHCRALLLFLHSKLLSRTAFPLPLALEKTGKPVMGRLALVKNLCELLRFRKGLNLNNDFLFFEMPDF